MISELFSNYTFRIIFIGTIILGLTAGVLGVFLLLKKQALVGDALSHATLPGVVLAYIITKDNNMLFLIIGAFIAALISILLFNVIKRFTKIKNDSILALILSSFFGFGQVLISLINNVDGSGKSGLNNFIFGQAATMLISDVYLLVIIGAVVLVSIIFFWKHLKLFSFDAEFYQSLGYSKKFLDFLLSFLTIVIVVAGIRIVGVILMSALLIAPGVAARQWSNKIALNAILAGIFGIVGSFLGTAISISQTDVPTGPMIVVVVSIIVVISILFAPRRGILSKEIKKYFYKLEIRKYKLLIHVYENDKYESINELELEHFIKEGLIEKTDNQISFTDKGHKKIKSLLVGR